MSGENRELGEKTMIVVMRYSSSGSFYGGNGGELVDSWKIKYNDEYD